eukprot:12319563-Heterocapsa_arctica.AAC.1
MYYDDVTLQDLAVAKGQGQRYVRALFRLIGLPLAVPKTDGPQQRGRFPGAHAHHEGCARDRRNHLRPPCRTPRQGPGASPA